MKGIFDGDQIHSFELGGSHVSRMRGILDEGDIMGEDIPKGVEGDIPKGVEGDISEGVGRDISEGVG